MKYTKLTLMAGLFVLSGCMAMHPVMHSGESAHDMESMEMPMTDEQSTAQEKGDEKSSPSHGKHKLQPQNSKPIWGR